MRRLLTILLTSLCLTVTSLPATQVFAQNQSKADAKTEPRKTKGGQEAQCDGALEIVPQKEMTFTRKRRPSRSSSGTQDATPAKTDRKSTSF